MGIGRAFSLEVDTSVLGSVISRVSGPDDWANADLLERRRTNKEETNKDPITTSWKNEIRNALCLEAVAGEIVHRWRSRLVADDPQRQADQHRSNIALTRVSRWFVFLDF